MASRPFTTRELIEKLDAIINDATMTMNKGLLAPIVTFRGELRRRYNDGRGVMLIGPMKAAARDYVLGLEKGGSRYAAKHRPPVLTDAAYVPVNYCAACGTETSPGSTACRSCHGKEIAAKGGKEQRQIAGRVRGAQIATRAQVMREMKSRVASLEAREQALREAEARLEPYRPPVQLRFKGKGFPGFGAAPVGGSRNVLPVVGLLAAAALLLRRRGA